MSGTDDLINQKIVSLEELETIIPKLKSLGKVIVHCHGVYDLLTPAHTHQFLQAKAKGDVVIVTITEDKHVNKGPGRPYFNELLRARQIACQMMVDYVAISRQPTGVECIRSIKPDFFVKGESNINYERTGDLAARSEIEEVRKFGGDVFFTKELPVHSSEILNKFLPVFRLETQKWLNEFKKLYSPDKIIAQLRGLKKVKCLLVGEAIIDEYCYVRVMGKPTKGTHLAADAINNEIQAGGILAAANHLAGFCDQVDVLACVGNDGEENALVGLLSKNINPAFFRRDGPTIVKRRFVESHSLIKLFETYEGSVDPLSEALESELRTRLDDFLGVHDLVLVIDYGHGFLNEQSAEFISSKFPWLALSVQANTANFGYNLLTKYPRADYVCIDEHELRLALHNQWEDPNNLAKQLIGSSSNDFKKIILTKGHQGCLVPVSGFPSQEIPAFSSKVVDTMGADDAFTALTSPCVRTGMPIEVVGFIGNAVGALKVGTVGNRSPVNPLTLFNFINTLLK